MNIYGAATIYSKKIQFERQAIIDGTGKGTRNGIGRGCTTYLKHVSSLSI